MSTDQAENATAGPDSEPQQPQEQKKPRELSEDALFIKGIYYTKRVDAKQPLKEAFGADNVSKVIIVRIGYKVIFKTNEACDEAFKQFGNIQDATDLGLLADPKVEHEFKIERAFKRRERTQEEKDAKKKRQKEKKKRGKNKAKKGETSADSTPARGKKKNRRGKKDPAIIELRKAVREASMKDKDAWASKKDILNHGKTDDIKRGSVQEAVDNSTEYATVKELFDAAVDMGEFESAFGNKKFRKKDFENKRRKQIKKIFGLGRKEPNADYATLNGDIDSIKERWTAVNGPKRPINNYYKGPLDDKDEPTYGNLNNVLKSYCSWWTDGAKDAADAHWELAEHTKVQVGPGKFAIRKSQDADGNDVEQEVEVLAFLTYKEATEGKDGEKIDAKDQIYTTRQVGKKGKGARTPADQVFPITDSKRLNELVKEYRKANKEKEAKKSKNSPKKESAAVATGYDISAKKQNELKKMLAKLKKTIQNMEKTIESQAAEIAQLKAGAADGGD